jgi:hypothetical protein
MIAGMLDALAADDDAGNGARHTAGDGGEIGALEATRGLSEAVVSDCLAAFGQVRVRLTGRCMRPALDPGERLLIASLARCTPRLGDVVLTRQEGGLRLHRLLWRPRMGLGRWLTAADHGPWDGAIATDRVLGSVVALEGRGGHRPSRVPWFRTVVLSTARQLASRLGLRRGVVHG